MVSDQGITLTQTGWRGRLAHTLYGESIARAYALYGLWTLAMLAWGVRGLLQGDLLSAGFVVGAALLARTMWTGRDLVGALHLPGARIRGVVAHPPSGLKRGHFEVLLDWDGKPKRRLVMMPSTLSPGDFEAAHNVLREALP